MENRTGLIGSPAEMMSHRENRAPALNARGDTPEWFVDARAPDAGSHDLGRQKG